ncbi:group II truncated hemoglobin [Martelella mediterranea]|uniref:Hemoglobin n=1 Tax=Martelella mediterranea TaxID=293089 RepID=A0A4R3NVG9_9HYPH|nr:group II truncated hemoglobin [Martelella mediterranea]TCT42035.1 hemoglobin [Martelella mediterranea]
MSEPETTTIYEAIGGAETVARLTQRFYALMDTLPEAKNCRAIHPQDLSGSEAKFRDYLTGYFGGPPVYVEKHGHPRLKMRHMPAPIGADERDEWLLCFRLALEETVPDVRLRGIIMPPVEKLAYHMQNKG